MSAVSAAAAPTKGAARPVLSSNNSNNAQHSASRSGNGTGHAATGSLQADKSQALESSDVLDSSSKPGAFMSSLDDEAIAAVPQMGYKDELELRFIWDRKLGEGALLASLHIQTQNYNALQVVGL